MKNKLFEIFNRKKKQIYISCNKKYLLVTCSSCTLETINIVDNMKGSNIYSGTIENFLNASIKSFIHL